MGSGVFGCGFLRCFLGYGRRCLNDWVCLQDRTLQIIFAGIVDRTAALVGHFQRLPKLNAPFEKQLQLGFHRMGAGFHHDEIALGHGF